MRFRASFLAGYLEEATINKSQLFKLQGTGIMDVAIGLRVYERLRDSSLPQRI